MITTPEQDEVIQQICDLVRECIKIGVEQERSRCFKIADIHAQMTSCSTPEGTELAAAKLCAQSIGASILDPTAGT